MIKSIQLKNFKSFRDIVFNFEKTKKEIKKMVLVYGENGSGKTNLISTLLALLEFSETRSNSEKIKKLLEVQQLNEEYVENANFLKILKNNMKETIAIIKEYKTISSEKNMVLNYEFEIDGKKASYTIETDNEKIVHEKLDYVLNKNICNLFDIKEGKTTIHNEVITDKDYLKEIQVLLEQYWGKHTFISVLFNEMNEKKEEYIKSKISKDIIAFNEYIKKICMKIKRSENGLSGVLHTSSVMWKDLYSNSISIDREPDLISVENNLNKFFTLLYSDIKQVYFEIIKTEKEIKYELYLKKMIGGNLIDIKFKKESTGTKKLLLIMPYLIAAINGEVVLIDEIDSNIHDVLMGKILLSVKDSIKGQLIITTHNTHFLELPFPMDSIYMFNLDYEANKEFVCIKEFDRIQKNHNIRKKYLNGEFGGIPIVSEFDFEDVIEN